MFFKVEGQQVFTAEALPLGHPGAIHLQEDQKWTVGADYSSKFSPWLASGALSAREIHHEVKRYEAEHGANESTYWLSVELLWRDFFQFTAAKHGPPFQACGNSPQTYSGTIHGARFQAWCEGRTCQAFIDANMRELVPTGWMSNRGRQNVASYLVHDLGLDWRMGAYWFERMLIDYDPCSNWGNWQYLAGVGNDPSEGRRFDPSVRHRCMTPKVPSRTSGARSYRRSTNFQLTIDLLLQRIDPLAKP